MGDTLFEDLNAYVDHANWSHNLLLAVVLGGHRG
jgi:hypothetical protein